MSTLKEFISHQLGSLCSLEGTELINSERSVTLITTIYFDTVHITVPKEDALAGWKRKNTSKNGYSISFEITPISDEQINIDVYSQGIIANSMLFGQIEEGTRIWKFYNFNNSLDSYKNVEYPYINFTNSFNQSNPFTSFINYYICYIKDCLNNEFFDYLDSTQYDNEPRNSVLDIKGDLVLTIRENTFNILRKKAFLKLADGRTIKLDKSMLGKKIVLRENDLTVFYPLNEEDFILEGTNEFDKERIRGGDTVQNS